MGLLIYTLVVTHITIICVTLYLHRSQAHRGVTFHPALSHFFRFWLWLTTGMVTRQWVAIHRKHHRFSDVAGDPHTPHIYGIWRVLFNGAMLYHHASKDPTIEASYGKGTPDDWIEQKVYRPHSRLGVSLLLIFNLVFFGWWGFLVWGVQMIWIPFFAAGVVNGVGHFLGYKNGKTDDFSSNIIPWGVLIGGEELHNNHHLDPASSKLSRRWFEFDIGWFYIKSLELFGLATLRQSYKK